MYKDDYNDVFFFWRSPTPIFTGKWQQSVCLMCFHHRTWQFSTAILFLILSSLRLISFKWNECIKHGILFILNQSDRIEYKWLKSTWSWSLELKSIKKIEFSFFPWIFWTSFQSFAYFNSNVLWIHKWNI